MNQIEAIKRAVERSLIGATASIDKPIKPGGAWMLDAAFRKRVVNVEWRRHRGFGISSGRPRGFGEGPDEVLKGARAAVKRVVELLAGSAETAAPEEVTLKELRARRRLSQSDFARRLHVSQAAVSELENNLSRSKVSTLLRVMRALGAKLEVHAVVSESRAFRLKL